MGSEMKRDHPLAVLIRAAQDDFLRGASSMHDDMAVFIAKRVLASYALSRGDSPLGFASALASGGNRDPEPSSAAGAVAEQRDTDDCTICAIAMATGLPYERVMEVAAKSVGGYRYQGKPGTMSPKGVLQDLGFEAQRACMTGVGSHTRTRLLWGRRAILSMPSLNGYDGHHDVYWDGRAIRDPSPKVKYAPDALASVEPMFAVVLDEAAAPLQPFGIIFKWYRDLPQGARDRLSLANLHTLSKRLTAPARSEIVDTLKLAADVRWKELADGAPLTPIDYSMMGELHRLANIARAERTASPVAVDEGKQAASAASEPRPRDGADKPVEGEGR